MKTNTKRNPQGHLEDFFMGNIKNINFYRVIILNVTKEIFVNNID